MTLTGTLTMNTATTTSTYHHNVWTTLCKKSASAVDNRWLPPSHLTTQLQDVLGRVVVCDVATVGTYVNHTLYPQSTGLITVIKSSYKHPHLTIDQVTQGANYEI